MPVIKEIIIFRLKAAGKTLHPFSYLRRQL